jgi:hypothetical protein
VTDLSYNAFDNSSAWSFAVGGATPYVPPRKDSWIDRTNKNLQEEVLSPEKEDEASEYYQKWQRDGSPKQRGMFAHGGDPVEHALRLARGGYADGGDPPDEDVPHGESVLLRESVTPRSLAQSWTPPEEAIAAKSPIAADFMAQYPQKMGEAAVNTFKYPGQLLYGEKELNPEEATDWANTAAGIAMTGGIGGVPVRAGEAVLGSGPVKTNNGVSWNFFEDAKKLNKNDFLNKYAIEPDNPAKASHAEMLKIAEKQNNIPAHYEYDPKNLDPFEMESWKETLRPQSEKQVQELQSAIQKNNPIPPVLVEGSPYDKKYRPMVLDGHHRTIAALNENASSIPVFFTNKTLNEIWSHLNKVNEKAHGGAIPFGPEAARSAVKIAKQQAGRR